MIDFGVMNLLTIVFKVPKIGAQACSFSIAVINNFLLNRHWTYPGSRGKSFGKQFLLFALISIAGLVIRTPLFWGLSNGITYLIEKFASELTINPELIGNNTALAICIVVVLLWNYFANRKWTFND